MKKKWFNRLAYPAILVAALSLLSFALPDVSGRKIKTGKAQAAGSMVILELFTSQGCSSCPPADALLAEYVAAHDAHIVPLSFHVDYWNRLGWVDPFSNAAYSERQQWYSQHLPKGSVYTPQLIVNGRREAVGNNRALVMQLIQKELALQQQATVEIADISIGKNSLNFSYKTTATSNDLLNIALIEKQATTAVKAGENRGASITNRNIVRSFITQPAGTEGKGLISLPPSFKPAEYALVVYVQNKKDLSISSAVMKEL